jgi:Fe-S oxidoreductase
MLTEAKSLLSTIVDVLEKPIESGVPVVVLEPSCASVFKDELHNWFPQNENAKRLAAQTFLFSEFLEKKAPRYKLPELHRKALLHGHCHHKSLFKLDDEEHVLQKMGVEYRAPETGCCGMAGAFGFETNHYDIAMKCGERVLLPEVRKTPKYTLIIADGFSCHEQIAQTTDRQSLDIAQVIQMAMHEGAAGTPGTYPERNYVRQDSIRTWPRTALMIAGAIGAGALMWKAGQALRCRA